ncbi:MAG: hypothetical protein ACLQNV_05475 [Steroidobacteraceae bacterium]
MPRRFITGLVLALCVLGSSSAFALERTSCKLTNQDFVVLATLKHPIKRDQQGRMVWDGKAMSHLQIQDLCITRRFYDLMVDREKHGKSLTLKEIADVSYIPGYLTEDEKKRLKDHIYRVLHQ